MKTYILGYYCKEKRHLTILNKGSNSSILDALLDAYPSALTATELADKTRLPEKTIYAQLNELNNLYINKIDNRKLSPPRGRPSSNPKSEVIQRKSSSVVIENANKLFDLNHGKKDTNLPPGNVSYSEDFIKNISKILDQKDQINMNEMMIPIIEKIYRLTTESEDEKIKSIAPTNNKDYWCSQCGLNHEARDFIRAILLYMIDQFEQSKDFIEFLNENKLLTPDAYENVSKKIDINFEMGLKHDNISNIPNNSIMNNKSDELSISKNSYEYDRDVKKIKNYNNEDQSFVKEDIYEKEIRLLFDGKIDKFNELREKDNFEFLDLEGADLSGAHLSRAILSGAILSGANLSNASLEVTNLLRANLSRANLSTANLSRANLLRANLSNANLSRANLSEANLSRAILSNANLSGVILSDTDLSDANLSGANLSDSIIINSKDDGLIIDKNTNFNNGITDNWTFIDYISEFTKNVPEKIKDKKELQRKLIGRISIQLIGEITKNSKLPD